MLLSYYLPLMNDYHVRQYHTEYESTRRFMSFLDQGLELANFEPPASILDIGCGAGANTTRLARKFINSQVCGIDLDSELIKYALKMNSESTPNLDFQVGDLFEYELSDYEGVTAIQTISWVSAEDMYLPFERVLLNQPKWFAFSSLGFEGKAQARIEVEDFSDVHSWSTPYNILSNILLREKANSLGYEEVIISSYHPNDPIIKVAEGMGSHTRVLDSNQLILFSGPLYLPWYFYFFKRK
jgi:SAM-dependent methyltransferase